MRKRDYPLGFGVEGHQVVFNHGASRPATDQERELWSELVRVNLHLARCLEGRISTNARLVADDPSTTDGNAEAQR